MILDFQHRSSPLKMMQLVQSSKSHVKFLSGTQSKTNSESRISQHRPIQLQFNRNIPTVSCNLAVQYSNPNPIVIEKLRQSLDCSREKVDADWKGSNNSTTFSVVSEDRLNLAIQLARRDVKRRNVEEKAKEHLANEDHSKLHHRQRYEPSKKDISKNAAAICKPMASVSFKRGQHVNQHDMAEITSSGAKVYVYTPDHDGICHGILDSPPTHDPGSGPKRSPKLQVDESVQEVQQLQKQLSKYIHKIGELAKRDHSEDILDPDEERRSRIRRQEQSARSARMLYVLQQQVKNIQEDLEELSPCKIRHTKKSRTLSRLAAVHRGAIRALQMFVTQLTDQAEHQEPSHYKKLGHIIRQLSLCSAKLEATTKSSLSDTILFSLQQVEKNLESLMEKKRTPQKWKKPSSSHIKSSLSREGSPERQQSLSPKKGKKPLPISKDCVVMERKPLPVVRTLLTGENEMPVIQEPDASGDKLDNKQAESITNLNRKVDIALLMQERLKNVPSSSSAPFYNKGVLLPERPEGFRHPRKFKSGHRLAKHAHFQEKTLAFRLKETHGPLKDVRTAWIPPNPTSPPASPKRSTNSVPVRLPVNQHLETRADKLRCQDSVQRRFNQIVYTDPEFWGSKGRESSRLERKPVSPRPIRITRTVGCNEPEVDIVLEEPLNPTDGSLDVEEKSEIENDNYPPVPEKMFWPNESCTLLSVPRQMLKSVHDCKDVYEQHLKLISHEAIGSFNPWHITESIAEELMKDALDEIAAELQDLCEDYAEAVFTSEFLQPLK
ncbi:protein moonraker isoform X2 [Ambystoma mexicanum]|uniref:protein moonraker isoform X2 n=1 Tax=Ambystoma mexicanum TaxID=8296 RepID=UPI0037E6FCB0